MAEQDLEKAFRFVQGEALRLLKAIRQLAPADTGLPYERLAWRILSDFASYGLEDLARGEEGRARTCLGELQQIAREASSQVDAIRDGRTEAKSAPRFTTSQASLSGTHFEAACRGADGEVRQQPVIFTGYGHFGQVRRDLANFPDYGVNIIQVEIGPSSTVTGPEETGTDQLDSMAKLLDLAAEANVAVNLLISPHYFPAWALKRYPHLSRCEGGFIRFCIDAPEAREIIERHIRTVIARVGRKPALHSVCLSNEPIYRSCGKDEYTKALWGQYLRDRFKSLDEARGTLGVEAERFEDFPIPSYEEVSPTPLFYEWSTFNQNRFASWHRWMASIVQEVCPDLPVHAKIMPTILERKNIGNGVDPKLFCNLSQINGNDCWFDYAHGSGGYASHWLVQNIFYDMLRSFSPKPIFNSENHIIPDREKRVVPPEHVRTALWQGAVHGQGATTIWVWERTYDERSDFAGSIMHRPLCVRAAGETALDLMRFSEEIATLQSVKPSIALLYSIPSIIYRPDYLDQLKKAYEALNFTGRRIAILPGEQLDPEEVPLLVVPEASHIRREGIAGIKSYMERGGRVVLIGSHCLERDERDLPLDDLGLDVPRIRPDLPPKRLRDALLPHLGPTEISPVSPDGRLPWGVEWLSCHGDAHWLLNAVNLVTHPQTIRWIGEEGREFMTRDLLHHSQPTTMVSLRPLQPVLLEVTTAR